MTEFLFVDFVAGFWQGCLLVSVSGFVGFSVDFIVRQFKTVGGL